MNWANFPGVWWKDNLACLDVPGFIGLVGNAYGKCKYAIYEYYTGDEFGNQIVMDDCDSIGDGQIRVERWFGKTSRKTVSLCPECFGRHAPGKDELCPA